MYPQHPSPMQWTPDGPPCNCMQLKTGRPLHSRWWCTLSGPEWRNYGTRRLGVVVGRGRVLDVSIWRHRRAHWLGSPESVKAPESISSTPAHHSHQPFPPRVQPDETNIVLIFKIRSQPHSNMPCRVLQLLHTCLTQALVPRFPD